MSRGSNCPKWPFHILSPRTSKFHTPLYNWHTEAATARYSTLNFWSTNFLLHKKIVEDIIVFINISKLVTLQDLCKKTNWVHCNEYGKQVVALIQQFFFPSSSLYVSTPLAQCAHPIAALTTPLSSMASLAHPNALNAFSNVLNSPLNSASLTSETHKPRALSTCMVCFQKGHRRAPFPSLISFLDADKYS